MEIPDLKTFKVVSALLMLSFVVASTVLYVIEDGRCCRLQGLRAWQKQRVEEAYVNELREGKELVEYRNAVRF